MNNPKLDRLKALSIFANLQIDRLNERFTSLMQSGFLERSITVREFKSSLQTQIKNCLNEDDFMQQLRIFRNLQQIRIIYRMLNDLSDYHETVEDVSNLACICLDVTYHWLYNQLTTNFGYPVKDDNSPMHMVIIGMGKLGAHELNLSSDIDLIFAYPHNGITKEGKKSIDNHTFFTKLSQKLIKILHQTTKDGFVFRVDMRLRPFGDNSNIVSSFDSLLHYYQAQGRNWERYALIKASPVAGNLADGEQLMDMLRPFVYRSYLDFAAIESLREMKNLIMQEVKLQKRHHNIKLGSGGIREVEFIAQVMQLIYGGKYKKLQQRNLLDALNAIENIGFLTAQTIKELQTAYIFLRNTEHALQAINDQQIQELPTNPEDQKRLTQMLNFANWQDFNDELNKHRTIVAQHFANLISNDAEQSNHHETFKQIWQQEDWQNLNALGFTDIKQTAQNLRNLADLAYKKASKSAVTRLNILMPNLLSLIIKHDNPDILLSSILPILQAILKRPSYFSLLNENTNSINNLVDLCAKSAFIAERIANYPLLLNELLDGDLVDSAPQVINLNQSLQHILSRSNNDLEQQMETLRHFKLRHELQAAAAYLSGNLTLMKASDYLTFIAEAILKQSMQIAWRQVSAKYGTAPNCDVEHPNFIIVGYGKLGGLEMGFGSDLDLVFLYDGNPNINTTNGDKSIEIASFYARLAQKIMHILTTYTISGNLYKIDLRLRPSGNSGLLVSSIKSFETYQQQNAQIWEHQALLRARFLVGDKELATRFNLIRQQTLSQNYNHDLLRQEISNMRQKMRENSVVKDDMFALKTDAGGIIDLEFIVQFLALANAHQHKDLIKWSDNIRILDELKSCGVLSLNQTQRLQAIYLAFRDKTQKLFLQKKSTHYITNDELLEERQYIIDLWKSLSLSI